MEEFDYRKFLVENKLTPNSRLLSENMEGVEINGNTPIPVDPWKEYYQEFVEEIEGSMYAIEPEDQSFAKDTVEHMKTGIQNPPSTLDAAMEFLRKQYQLSGNGFGMLSSGGNPTQAILDIVILHNNENPSTQFDADQLDDIEKYIDANYGNINEEEQLLSEEFDEFSKEELSALEQYEDTGTFPEWLSDTEGEALVAKWRSEYEDDFTDPAGGSGLYSHA
mgnify:CR=1 FL=1